MRGFYTSTTWGSQRQPLSLVPACGACGLYQHCQSPKMRVDGEGKRKVLILGEAPGENEDEQGKPLVGAAGTHLSALLFNIGVRMRRDCWLTNALVCRPQDSEGHNRTPTKQEVAHCRPNLIRVLRELKPDVVIPVGAVPTKSIVPLAWKDGEIGEENFSKWVGWQIPSQKLNCWICPTYHPSYLLREAKNLALELHTLKHLAAAFSLEGKPWPKPCNWEQRVVTTLDPKKAVQAIRLFQKRKLPVAFDYETDRLKPDNPDASILCCAVSDGEAAIAYPWQGEAITATKELLLSDTPKIASNLRFEERWTRAKLGIAVKNWLHDTVLGAHWLNCIHGICSLKFQAFVLLGMPDYDSHLEPYMRSRDSNSPNKLRQVEPEVLLKYCGMDALLEVLVYQKQMEDVL